MTSRPSIAAPILAVLAIVLVTLGGYLAGYFWLGRLSTRNLGIGVVNGVEYREVKPPCRNFNASWQAALYGPVGTLESWLRGVDIEITSSDE
jgi:hypothetical protein